MFQQQFEYFIRCQFPKKNGQGLCTRKAIDGSQFCKQHTNLLRERQGMPRIPFRQKQQAQQPLNPFITSIIQQMFPNMNNPLMNNPLMGNPLMGNPLMGNPLMGNPLVGNPLVGNPLVQKNSPFSPFFKRGKRKVKKPRGRLSSYNVEGVRLCPKNSAEKYNKLASPRLKLAYKDNIISQIINIDPTYDESDRFELRRKHTKTLCELLKKGFEENPSFSFLGSSLFEDDEEDY